jgi:ferredoxin
MGSQSLPPAGSDYSHLSLRIIQSQPPIMMMWVADDQSISDAAAEQNIDRAASCRAGAYSFCAGKRISGGEGQKGQSVWPSLA